jgi:hypothetical protein
MNLLDLIPPIHNTWEFIYAILLLGLWAWQFKVLNTVKKQTNGLISSTVESAKASSRMEGQLEGAASEQVRIAKKLALSDEVAARLAGLKSNDGE